MNVLALSPNLVALLGDFRFSYRRADKHGDSAFYADQEDICMCSLSVGDISFSMLYTISVCPRVVNILLPYGKLIHKVKLEHHKTGNVKNKTSISFTFL